MTTRAIEACKIVEGESNKQSERPAITPHPIEQLSKAEPKSTQSSDFSFVVARSKDVGRK